MPFSDSIESCNCFCKPQIAETSDRISELQKQLQASIESEKGKELLATIGQRRTDYVGIRKDYFQRLSDADPIATSMLSDKLMPAANQYVGAMKTLYDLPDRVGRPGQE